MPALVLADHEDIDIGVVGDRLIQRGQRHGIAAEHRH